MYYVPIEMTKAYVRENEIYATVNGEIIRITPDMIKKIIRNGVVTEVYFSEVENKEIYEREDRCWIPNGKGKIVRCTGNCASCEHRNENAMLSIEAAEEDGGLNLEATSEKPDAIVEDAELLKALWERVGELCDEDQTIIKMFSNGASEREIATKVNLSQKGVNKRKKTLFELLKNYLKDFF